MQADPVSRKATVRKGTRAVVGTQKLIELVRAGKLKEPRRSSSKTTAKAKGA